MTYDLCELRARFQRGENITALLKNADGLNDETSIEIAYDLQSGEYVKWVHDHPILWRERSAEMARVLSPYVYERDSVLDCGTGEMTTLAGLGPYVPESCSLFAFDISLSRLCEGRAFLRSCNPNLLQRTQVFCAAMSAIPLPDDSVDVVVTSHALEPNRGRERQLLQEIFRVSRRHAVFFEPSYEHATREGQKRMDRLGYVRDLEGHVQACGGTVIECHPLAHTEALNPTYAWVVSVPRGSLTSPTSFVCPITKSPLVGEAGCLWSESGLYAYPVIREIPVLKKGNAIVLMPGSTI
jgi:SAM-dependent methyltransferase